MDNFDYKRYLAEGRLLKEEMTSPSGWTEIKDLSDMHRNEEEGEIVVKAWDAPMEGWDEEHKDSVIIRKEDDKFYLDGYVSYGEFEMQGPFDTYEETLKLAVEEMEAFKEDWDEDLAEGKLLKENQGTQVTDHMWGRMSDDEKINALLSVSDDPDIAEKYYEYDWTELPSRYSTMIIYESKLGKENLEDIRLYIQKELGRAGEQNAGLDAYIDSIQRDFAAGRDAYDDYEMDDYLEDFENYIADKMDY
jgi:hypothetical protein